MKLEELEAQIGFDPNAPDPFAGLEHPIAATYAYVYYIAGEEGLRYLFDLSRQIEDGPRECREDVERNADELDGLGFQKVAEIVRDEAGKLPTLIAQIIQDEMDTAARLGLEPGSSIKGHLAEAYRWGKITLDDLTTEGIDPEIIQFVARFKAARQCLIGKG